MAGLKVCTIDQIALSLLVEALALNGGASGIMIGGYLTTAGRGTDRDMQMLKDLDRPRSVPNLD